MSALRQLQDDEARVRAVTRHAIQKAFDAVDAASPKGSLSDATVLPVAVEYVSATFVRTGYGATALSKVLIQLIDAPSVLAAYASAKARDWDDLCRRIFEFESSNYFAERDVLAQNIVYSLLAPATEDVKAICFLRKQVLTLVVSALETLNQEAQNSDDEGGRWLGGIIYYPDVFSPLFGLLAAGVAIVTSTSCLLTDDLLSLVSQVRMLAQEVSDIYSTDNVTHPLVLRAFELLASKDQDTSKQDGIEPVRELLYLTPYWMALTDSRSN
ncbi:unnamed protein product [Peronospora farinosa]|nr:unnamed protein product [Peronospora farinosa]